MALGESAGLLFKIQAKDETGPAFGRARDELGRFTKTAQAEAAAAATAFNRMGQAVGLSTSQVSSLSRNLPIAGAAIAGVSAATVGTAAALFGFAKNAAAAGDEIDELGAKTGLGAESLTTLDFALKQSGSNLQEFSSAFVIYQKNLTEAAAKGQTLFGIDANRALQDQEFALRALVTTLNGPLPQGYSRSSFAAELLGRSGANLIATFQTIGPEFERFIAQAKRLGVVLTEDDIKAAREFSDTLDVVGAQFSAVANKAALQYTPALTDVLRQTSQLATDVQPALAGAMKLVTIAIGEQAAELRGWSVAFRTVANMAAGLSAIPAFTAAAVAGGTSGTAGGTGGAQGGGPAMSEAAADKLIGDSIKNLNRAALEALKDAEAARKAAEQVEREARELAEAGARLIQAERERIFRNLTAAHAHQIDMEKALARQVLAVTDDLEERRKISHARAAQERIISDKREHDLRANQLQQQLKLARDLNLDPELVAGLERQVELHERLGSALSTEADIRARGAVRQDTADRLANVAAINQQAAALLQAQGLQPVGPSAAGGFGGGGAGGDWITDPQPPDVSVWDQWKQAATDSMGEVMNAGEIMHESMTAVFSGVAQGAGAMVQAFLMGEKFSAKAFAAMAKAAIASVAAQAAVRAIFELAMFFATSWLNPAEAASHLLAAKTFGLVAAAAAAVSLAIPGGGAGGGAGYGAAASAASDPYANYGEDERTRRMREQSERDRFTTREDRRGPTVVQLIVDGKKLGEAVLDDLRQGGDTRNGWKSALGVT